MPRGVAPSKKFTDPVGVPYPGAVAETVAVKVMDWPKTLGFAELAIAVVVCAWLITWLRTLDVLGASVESPE